MQGVVSLLDETHQDRIAQLQDLLEREAGVCGLCQTPIPHLSYHVADAYEPDLLAATLLSFAGSNAAIHVRTSGVGVFTGEHIVVYLPVVRSPILSAMHHVLWRQLGRSSYNPSVNYHPDNWLPHITLIDHVALPENLPAITRVLQRVDLRWQIELNNIALLYGAGETIEIRFRHPLQTWSPDAS